jgi:phosphoribosylformimino-5-aminoimidazole carboxamide ribotide isomerase
MTRIRPCIDLHQGQVKQIVGSTLKDDAADSTSLDNAVQENFVSSHPPSYYTKLYQQANLAGGHVIMLGPNNSEAAQDALAAWPNGLQVGGGITSDNCLEWIQAGASSVIVTSHVFSDGKIHWERLSNLVKILGSKDKLVLDLSCRKKESDSKYYVVTDRWQTWTDTVVNAELLQTLSEYCSEFLIHAVDVEGMQAGILEDIVEFLGEHCPASVSVTYAGGVRSLDDLNLVERLGKGRVDVTVGSALDIFGGTLACQDVVNWHNERNPPPGK